MQRKRRLEIFTRFGGFALAVDQAAAYLQYNMLPVEKLDEFLETYEAQCKKIHQESLGHQK